MVLKASEKKYDESNGAFTTSDGMVAVGSGPASTPKKVDLTNGTDAEPVSKKVWQIALAVTFCGSQIEIINETSYFRVACKKKLCLMIFPHGLKKTMYQVYNYHK